MICNILLMLFFDHSPINCTFFAPDNELGNKRTWTNCTLALSLRTWSQIQIPWCLGKKHVSQIFTDIYIYIMIMIWSLYRLISYHHPSTNHKKTCHIISMLVTISHPSQPWDVGSWGVRPSIWKQSRKPRRSRRCALVHSYSIRTTRL